MMRKDVAEKLAEIVPRIKGLKLAIEPLIDALHAQLELFPDMEMEEAGASYWRAKILCDALRKVRGFVEKNLITIDALGVLALTRYVFELVVVLENLRANENFAFLYMRRNLRQQSEHFDNVIHFVKAEISFYETMEAEWIVAKNQVIKKSTKGIAVNINSRNGRRLGKKITHEINRASKFIDARLKRRFTLYGEDAVENGYGFQAQILRNKVLGRHVQNAEAAKASYEKIASAWKDKVESLPPKIQGWKWKEMSELVGMGEDYNFIYSFSSKLLHASPFGLTTQDQDLNDVEILMFLRYVEQQIHWILRYAEDVSRMRGSH